MKLLVLSDLHIDSGEMPLQIDGQRIDAGADLVVLAGDIHEGVRSPFWAREAFPDKPIILVGGNHELYGLEWDRGLDQLREAAKRCDVHFLENDAVEIDGVRFLGATLWTDYCLHGPDRQAKRMQEVEGVMTDFKEIRRGGAKLAAADVLARHTDSRQWLQRELNSCEFSRTVVVTHHAPSARSMNRYDAEKPIATAYGSDLSDLLGYSRHWIHGHVHEFSDYEVFGTRVVCNPRGYLAPDGNALSGFYPAMVIDVD